MYSVYAHLLQGLAYSSLVLKVSLSFVFFNFTTHYTTISIRKCEKEGEVNTGKHSLCQFGS